MGRFGAADDNPYASPESDISPQEESGNLGRVVYGGFLARFAAAFLDGIILLIFNSITQVAFTVAGTAAQVDVLTIAILTMIVNALVGWMYSALQESSDAQATLGKRALGLRVIDEHSGGKLTFGQATGRHFGKILSSVILGIGFLMQPFTEKRQALHDMLAKALVVKG